MPRTFPARSFPFCLFQYSVIGIPLINRCSAVKNECTTGRYGNGCVCGFIVTYPGMPCIFNVVHLFSQRNSFCDRKLSCASKLAYLRTIVSWGFFCYFTELTERVKKIGAAFCDRASYISLYKGALKNKLTRNIMRV